MTDGDSAVIVVIELALASISARVGGGFSLIGVAVVEELNFGY